MRHPPGIVDIDFVVPELGLGIDTLEVFIQPVFFHNDNTRLGVGSVLRVLDESF